MADLINRLLQEALAFHLEKPVRYVEGSEHKFVADFSSRGVVLMEGLGLEPVWLNAASGEEVVRFAKDGMVLELN
jgi:hypothetical protein